jgi:hypothetical protein
LKQKNKNQSLIYSKLENNFHLSNKKALFLNISNYYRSIGYDPFDVAIPLTFHIKSQNDPDFKNFEEVFNKFKQKKQSNIWIIKPGENSVTRNQKYNFANIKRREDRDCVALYR